MATLKFILRESRRGSAYTGKICARFVHARKIRVLTLDVSLYPGEWDEKEQKILFGEEGTLRYSYLRKAVEALRKYKEQFDEVVECLEQQGRYRVSDIIIGEKNHHERAGLYGFTLYLSSILDKSGQGRTARAYMTACRILIRFNKGKDIPLKQINTCLIKEFESYLKSCGRAMNTISYYMRMLRAIYNKAISEKIIEPKHENPFKGTFTGFQETRKRALDIEQLRKLNNLSFSALLEEQTSKKKQSVSLEKSESFDKGLYDCWRYFFFCFHARGMSYVDMAYLRKENIRHGVISYYRRKTGQKIEITVTPALQRIIESFSGEVCGSPYIFPIIKDMNKPARTQYESGLNMQNRRLKKLAKLAGINSRSGLSTHVSRHSWATTGKIQNLPLAVISEGLGHTSEKMTYTYLASFDRSTLDRANEKIARAIIDPPESSDFHYPNIVDTF